MLYFIAGFSVHRELDKWDEGCIPETSQMDIDDTKLRGSTQKNLIKEVQKHFDVEPDAISLNACGEQGRIDVQRYETADGYKASPLAIEKWRAGKLRLYLANYTGYLEVKKFGPKWRKLKDCNYD